MTKSLPRICRQRRSQRRRGLDPGGVHRRAGDIERNAEKRWRIRARTLIVTTTVLCHECPVLRVRGAPFRIGSTLRVATPRKVSSDHNSSVSRGNESWTRRPNRRQHHNAGWTGRKTQTAGCVTAFEAYGRRPRRVFDAVQSFGIPAERVNRRDGYTFSLCSWTRAVLAGSWRCPRVARVPATGALCSADVRRRSGR